MSCIQVLGIGSPFGDDQVGWKIVDILEQHATLKKYVPQKLHFAILDRPNINLLQHIDKTATVMLIDAMKSGENIGTLHRYENPQTNTPAGLLSTHGMGVAQALQLGMILDELPKKIILYGIEIDEVLLQSELSPRVKDAAYQLAEIIVKELLPAFK